MLAKCVNPIFWNQWYPFAKYYQYSFGTGTILVLILITFTQVCFFGNMVWQKKVYRN